MKLKLFPEKASVAAVLPATTAFLLLLFLAVIPSYHDLVGPFARSGAPSPLPSERTVEVPEECDLFRGDWVPDPKAPYYTNETCSTIHENQNCMKHGRPDTAFMRWRWKPEGCELPAFDPRLFFEIARGKSLAFIGDSVSRNHMQSLMCLLSRVANPVEIEKTKVFFYPGYNLTIVNFWSTFLVKAESTGPDEDLDGAFHLHVDKPDPKWAATIASFDYVVISAGQWFYRPCLFYEENKLVNCYRCNKSGVPQTALDYGYRRAFRTSLAYLNNLADYNGMTFVRTYSPSHFENGMWNNGGDCVRRRPTRRNETKLEGLDLWMREAQVKEFRTAQKEGAKRGLKHHLLDITSAMVLRGDGHPSRYRSPSRANAGIRDCVHWCMPGPVDSWSDLLLEIVRRERLKVLPAAIPGN